MKRYGKYNLLKTCFHFYRDFGLIKRLALKLARDDDDGRAILLLTIDGYTQSVRLHALDFPYSTLRANEDKALLLIVAEYTYSRLNFLKTDYRDGDVVQRKMKCEIMCIFTFFQLILKLEDKSS